MACFEMFTKVKILKYNKLIGKKYDKVILNFLKTKRNPLYINNQSVPRCKHFPPPL